MMDEKPNRNPRRREIKDDIMIVSNYLDVEMSLPANLAFSRLKEILKVWVENEA